MTVSIENKQFEMCPICSGPIKTWRVKKVANDSYNLDLCGDCGYAFVNPRPSIGFVMNYYSSFGHGLGTDVDEIPTMSSVIEQERNEPNSTIDARRLIGTIKSMQKEHGGKFLDIGCGFGFFSKEALQAGYDVVALELAENEIAIAKNIIGINPIECSFEEYEGQSETMSVVFMSQILEHALDVNLWIKKAHDLLVDDGIIAIALPNYGSIFRIVMQQNDPLICPPAHLNFFNSNSLSKLLENYGFKVEKIQWVSRIPIKSFAKRLPEYGKPLLPIVNSLSLLTLKLVDALHYGMMLNVYGRKVHR